MDQQCYGRAARAGVLLISALYVCVCVCLYVDDVRLRTHISAQCSWRDACSHDTCAHQPTHTCLMRPQTASRKQEQAIEQAKKQWISNAMAAQLEQVCWWFASYVYYIYVYIDVCWRVRWMYCVCTYNVHEIMYPCRKFTCIYTTIYMYIKICNITCRVFACMCTRICMHVCMYVCMYVFVCIFKHENVYVNTYPHQHMA